MEKSTFSHAYGAWASKLRPFRRPFSNTFVVRTKLKQIFLFAAFDPEETVSYGPLRFLFFYMFRSLICKRLDHNPTRPFGNVDFTKRFPVVWLTSLYVRQTSEVVMPFWFQLDTQPFGLLKL